MSDLYDTDFVTWSRQQLDLLRRRASGELVNEAEIDWPNVGEEIEALGRTEARAWRATIRRKRADGKTANCRVGCPSQPTISTHGAGRGGLQGQPTLRRQFIG
jgi:hypothetical protein